MIEEVSIKPILDIETLLKKNFKLIRVKKLDRINVEVIQSLFSLSKILDAFFYEITPLEHYAQEAISLIADKSATDNVIDALTDAVQELNRILGDDLPQPFHRNISKIESILNEYKSH